MAKSHSTPGYITSGTSRPRLTMQKCPLGVNHLSRFCRHHYLGFKLTRNSCFVNDKSSNQKACTGISGGQMYPPTRDGRLSSSLCLSAFLHHAFLPRPQPDRPRPWASQVIPTDAPHPPFLPPSICRTSLHGMARGLLLKYHCSISLLQFPPAL